MSLRRERCEVAPGELDRRVRSRIDGSRAAERWEDVEDVRRRIAEVVAGSMMDTGDSLLQFWPIMRGFVMRCADSDGFTFQLHLASVVHFDVARTCTTHALAHIGHGARGQPYGAAK